MRRQAQAITAHVPLLMTSEPRKPVFSPDKYRKETAEAEGALLSLCVQSEDVLRDVTFLLEPAHFHGDRRIVFEAILKLTSNDEPLNPNLLIDEISDKVANARNLITGMSFNPVEKDDLSAYVERLRTVKLHTDTMDALYGALNECKTQEPNPALFKRVEDRVSLATRSQGLTTKAVSVDDALMGARAEMQQAQSSGGFLGHKTDIAPFDRALGGIGSGQVTTLMAAPGVGKTALALQIAHNIASRGVPVAYASLEMSSSRLTMRLLSAISGIPYGVIRSGNIATPEQKHDLNQAAKKLRSSKLYFSPEGMSQFEDISAWFVRCHISLGVQVVILDNILSLPYDPDKERGHITQVANASQNIARAHNLAVLNLHHLKGRDSSEVPNINSGFGSAAIERHSANILTMHQPEPHSSIIEFREQKGRDTGEALFRLVFEKQYQRMRAVGR